MRFSRKELDLIDQLARGRSAKQVAEKSGAKEETVRGRVEELKAKLGAETQEQISARFVEVTGWENPPRDYAPFPPGDPED